MLNVGGALTWNRSRIPVLTTALDNWDTGGQVLEQHRNVPISFSPEWVASAFADFTVFKRSKSEMHSRIDHRFVSRQYIDNTGDDESALKAYQQTDLNVSWSWYPGGIDKVTLRCQVINLFDQFIISNAWIYRYISENYDATPDDPHVARLQDGSYKQSGYYPQAGIHAFVGLVVNF
jgi:iron complex outermembrane receptor protein